MKVFTGKVISTKMAKTAKVAVERVVAHPLYGKRRKSIKHYLVHDEKGAKDGDIVRFVASKPYSKLKKWNLIEVVGEKNSKAEKSTKSVKKGENK